PHPKPAPSPVQTRGTTTTAIVFDRNNFLSMTNIFCCPRADQPGQCPFAKTLNLVLMASQKRAKTTVLAGAGCSLAIKNNVSIINHSRSSFVAASANDQQPFPPVFAAHASQAA